MERKTPGALGAPRAFCNCSEILPGTYLPISLDHLLPLPVLLPTPLPCFPRACPMHRRAVPLSSPPAPPQGGGRWYRGRDVAGPQCEGAPVQAVQEGAAVLPQPVEEPGWERCRYLEKLVSEDQGGHGGVEPARVTSRERVKRGCWDPLGSICPSTIYPLPLKASQGPVQQRMSHPASSPNTLA